MKRIFYLFPLLLFLYFIVGCQTQEKDPFFSNWKSEGAESDSLVCLLERESLLERLPLDSVLSQISQLEKHSPNKAAFFKGRFLRINDKDVEAKEILTLLKANIDSSKYPYLAKRINRELAQVSKNNLSIFRVASHELNYFKSIKDPLLTATCYVDLANVFNRLNDFERSLHYLELAQDIYKTHGLEGLYLRNSINVAKSYSYLGMESKSDSIHEILYKSDILKQDNYTRELILRNYFLSIYKPELLWEAIQISKNDSSLMGLYPVHATLLSRYWLNNENLDSASYYAQQGIRNLEKTHELDHTIVTLHNYSIIKEIEGQLDSALYYSHWASFYVDSASRLNDVIKIESMESQRAIAAMEIESIERMSRERLLWSIIISIVILSTVIVLWITNKRRQTAKLQQIQSQLELEQERRSFAAKTLAMEEKQRIIGETRKRLQEMSQEGKIKNEVATELVSMIKMHESGQIEWDNFVTMFEKVSPNFTKNLKEKYPTLSENYIKLATYLFAGMTSFQIARLLMIRPESVHQARWRLRKKMNIPAEVTIEDALRELG